MLHLMALATLSAATTAIVDVSVIHPGSTHIAQHQNVVVQGDRIVSVDHSPPPRNARVVNAKGKYLIPGLWDMHVHWYERELFGLFTANGVTGIRQMFGAPELLKFRKEVEAGKLLGPRMVVGSAIVDGPQAFWEGSISAGSAEKGRAVVRIIKAKGYDFVKSLFVPATRRLLRNS
ncbi:MAG: hypothetical protein M3R13_02850 [Armatimonadota bacterium]|nr:hypothetical protein [Armatimonadota bacterium]